MESSPWEWVGMKATTSTMRQDCDYAVGAVLYLCYRSALGDTFEHEATPDHPCKCPGRWPVVWRSMHILDVRHLEIRQGIMHCS